MIYLEDMVDCLAGEGKWLFQPVIPNINPKDRVLVNSIANQINYLGKKLTQKQANAMTGICRRYRQQLEIAFGQDLGNVLQAPTSKLGIRVLEESSKKIVIDPSDQKNIKVFFPYDEKKISAIKLLAKNKPFDSGTWDQDEKCWKLPLTETNILFLNSNVITPDFEVCELYEQYVQQIEEISKNVEDHIPVLVKDNGIYKIVNAHPSVPQPTGEDLLEALFFCKRYGISTKSEEVYADIEALNLKPITKEFIDDVGRTAFKVDSSRHPIETFDDIVKFSTPILLIIPIGQELPQLKKWYNYFSLRNIEKSQISVMFRTDNSTDKDFNDLVRGFGLNNPITESTKVVIVSVKLPKPVVKSGIKFNAVINLNPGSNAHYTLSSFLNDHPDVIYYSDKLKQPHYV